MNSELKNKPERHFDMPRHDRHVVSPGDAEISIISKTFFDVSLGCVRVLVRDGRIVVTARM